MKKFKKIICACLAATQIFFFASCVKEEYLPTPESMSEHDFCRINGEDIYFATTEDIAELREPLIKLLSNRVERVESDGWGYDRVVPNPSEPSIAECYACGLFDVTADGIPELLIHPRGFEGSSGGVDYYVYDIKTGEKITEISSGHGSICLYFDTVRKIFAMVDRSGTQGGIYTQYTDLTVRTFNPEIGRYAVEVYLAAHYELELPPEKYNTVEYEINGSPASWFDYYSLYNQVYDDYVRIYETELILINWSDVSSDEDSRPVAAEKMADALLKSEQKFVIPNTNTVNNFGEELCLTKSN